ncbi:hypothetical protein Tco_1501114 [Tanacetum coccineum]
MGKELAMGRSTEYRHITLRYGRIPKIEFAKTMIRMLRDGCIDFGTNNMLRSMGIETPWEMYEGEVVKNSWMFKITNLIDVYAMVKMQEATNAVLKPRYNSSLLPTPKFSSNSVNKPVIGPFNSTNVNEVNQNVSKTGGNRPYRMTQNELKEKRAKISVFIVIKSTLLA